MNTPLQKAAQAMIDRWDSPYWKLAPTADYIAGLRKALDAELQQSVEPVARVESIMANGRPFISRLPSARLNEGDALYLHPPQQAREHRATEQLSKAFDAAVEVVGEHRVAKSLAVPSGERAELIAAHQELNMSNYGPDDVDALNEWANQAYDMLEADVQQAKQVPMTSDDIYQLAQRGAVNEGLTAIVREVEAHHGIEGHHGIGGEA